MWSSATAEDGRTYYFNKVTNVTQWTKPEEMMNENERATLNTPWNLYETKGKPYWSHKDTRESRWDPPEEVKQNLERIQSQAPPRAPA